MDKRKKTLSMIVVLFLILTAWFADAAYAAAANSGPPDSKPVAELTTSSNGIGWQPKVSYGQLIVTVTRPDGSVFRKTFEAGVNPYLDLSSIAAGDSYDGHYTYELRVIPVITPKVRGEEVLADVTPVQEALTQNGHFMVQGGAIINQNNTENLARPMDVVHADDVIITGSLCVGFDCLTDGTENFGFDTIKMKENNIRIFFDDTSTTAGFPANDWRIIANDSSSGGGNYLSIEDSTNSKTPFKIEANARTSAIYVNSSGRVGLGTSTPVLNLHILAGDTPSVRLDQDTSSGWTAQVWDIAGNESNFFIRDTTGGSKLPFRIQPGTPTNTITMKSDGKVGIGTWSPTYPMELDTTGINASIAIKRTDGATCYINATDAYANFGAVTNHPLRLVVNSAWKMRLDADGSLTMSNGATLTAGGTWTNASSRALKENIQNLNTDEALATLNNLNPVKFNYKVDKADKHVGFIAEDAPELVAAKDHKGMSPMDVVAVLTKVVQEQQKSIQEQQKTISELKEKIAQLEKK
jgi:hypothetical protein